VKHTRSPVALARARERAPEAKDAGAGRVFFHPSPSVPARARGFLPPDGTPPSARETAIIATGPPVPPTLQLLPA